jgi:DNA-binding IclR family transcriptional regulator
LGKAIAAFLPLPRWSALLSGELHPLTGRTITDAVGLRAAMEEVSASGFSVEDQEAIVGEAEIAAPGFDHRPGPVGAISVVGPVERLLPDGPAATLVAAVEEAGRGLSRDMGAGRFVARG